MNSKKYNSLLIEYNKKKKRIKKLESLKDISNPELQHIYKTISHPDEIIAFQTRYNKLIAKDIANTQS